MTELAFPLLGPVIVFAAILPASSLLAKLALLACTRLTGAHRYESCHTTRHLLLVASSAAPLAWLASACALQASRAEQDVGCLTDHAETVCPEFGYFSLVLAVVVVLVAVPQLLKDQVGSSSRSETADAAKRRVDELVRATHALRTLAGGVVVSDTAHYPIATLGILVPRVVLNTAFVERLDDTALCAALLHECEHVYARDPLRYFVAWWARTVNPIGSLLLHGDHAQWQFAREMECDRLAVQAGASPAALAEALVVAARPSPRIPVATLGSSPLDMVKMRLGLLLSYVDTPPATERRRRTWHLLAGVLVAAILLPHGAGTALLDEIHRISEIAGSLLA